MSKFIPTKRTNPCAACGDIKGKCRTFSDSTLILCMNSAGGTQRVGWINIGDTKDRLWGKLIPDDEQTRGKSWQDQQEAIARRIERERAIEKEKLKHALPIDERSPEFRKLLLQLTLDEDHYQNLIDRGLTDKEIKSNLYRTVVPYQKISGIKSNLPGIKNDEIIVYSRGYLCPIFDEHRRIIGCQVRLDDPKGEKGKYRWLSGEFSSHVLIEGNKELPITVLKGEKEGVYLCEGILKPSIANVIHNRTFIGASGGNFAKSPKQLERILKAVATDGKVYLCPDAGFNLNPQVQRRNWETIKLVQSLGYKVYILDWGQLNDKHSIGDVDEISSDQLKNATVISTEQKHQEISNILKRLSLSEEDHSQLKAKGLSEEQIQSGEYRSVKEGEINTAAGILIPIPNHEGNWVGLKLYNPTTNRFSWISYKSGEMPIAVHYPRKYQNYNRIGFCTGTEWKGKIAAEKLGIPVIGVDNNNFEDSRLTIKESLDYIENEVLKPKERQSFLQESEVESRFAYTIEIEEDEEEENNKSTPKESKAEIFIIPDPGVAKSKKSLEKYKALNKELTDWGYERKELLDWKQVTDPKAESITSTSDLCGKTMKMPLSEFTLDWYGRQVWTHLEEEAEGKEVEEEIYSRIEIETQLENSLKKAQDFMVSAQEKEQKLEKKQEIYVKKNTPKENNNEERYKPGKLPKSSNQTIKFKKGQRKQIISEAYAKGAGIVVDKSGTGGGKTHETSQLKKDNFDSPPNEKGETQYMQIALFLNEPSNPPVTLDDCDWVRLATITEGNCQNAEQRKALAQKGLGRSKGGGKSDANPICNSCPALNLCRSQGFKGEMKATLAAPKVYGHPNGFPREENSTTIAIYDEFSTIIPSTINKKISLEKIIQTFIRLEKEDRKLYEQLLPIKEILEKYLSGAKSIPKYGVDLASIKEELKKDWKECNPEILEEIKTLETQWETEDKQKINHNSTPEEIQEKIMGSWLSDFMGIIIGSESGSIRLGRKKGEVAPLLMINQFNREKIAQVKSFAMAILLDATLTKEDLVFEYGFNPEEILEIEQEQTPTPNFEIKQLTKAGLNTSQRSEAGETRKKTITSKLKEKHPDLGGIDYSKFAEEEELKHHRSGEEGARGSNRFKKKSAIMALGIPYVAVNSIVDEYQTITGEIVTDPKSDPKFRAYYDRKVEKEMIQVIGRARANLRPQEKVTCYLINDFNCQFLAELGVKVTSEPVWNLVPELKPSYARAIEGLSQFFASLAHQGEELGKAKLKDVASFLKMTQANLSRMLKRLGGWRELRKKINTLFKTIREDVNFLDQGWNYEEIIQTELGKIYGLDLSQSPELIAEAIAEYGWEKFEAYFSASHPTEKGELLASLLSLIVNIDHSLFGKVGEIINLNLTFTSNSPPNTT